MTEANEMPPDPAPLALAAKLWSLLERHAGARDGGWERDQFVGGFIDGSYREFRFQGSLGFGGKFWVDRTGPWRVTCYPEDETPERLAMIASTNAALTQLWNDLGSPGDEP